MRGRPRRTTTANSSAGRRFDRMRGQGLQFAGGPKKATLYAAAGVGYLTSVCLIHTPLAPAVMFGAMKAHAAAIAVTGVSMAASGAYVNGNAQRTQEIIDAQRAENAGLPPRDDRPSVQAVEDRHYDEAFPWDLPVHRDAAGVADGAEGMQRAKHSLNNQRLELQSHLYEAYTPQCIQDALRHTTDEELGASIAEAQQHRDALALAISDATIPGAHDQLVPEQELNDMHKAVESLSTHIQTLEEDVVKRGMPQNMLQRTELTLVNTKCKHGEEFWCGYEQGHDPTGVKSVMARNVVKMLPLSKWRVCGMCAAHMPIGPRELCVYWIKNSGAAFAAAHPWIAAAIVYGPSPGGWGVAIQPFTTWAGYEIGEVVAKAYGSWAECCVSGNTCCPWPEAWKKPAELFMRWRELCQIPAFLSKETVQRAADNEQTMTAEQIHALRDAIAGFTCGDARCEQRGECWCLEKLQADIGMEFPTLPHGTDMNMPTMREKSQDAQIARAEMLRKAVFQYVLANEHKLGKQVGYTTDVHGDFLNIPYLGGLVPKTALYWADEKGVQRFARVLNNEDGDYYHDHTGKMRIEVLGDAPRVVEIAAEAPCADADLGLVQRTIWEHQTCDKLMQSPHHNFHNKHYMDLWAQQYAAFSTTVNGLGLPPMDPRPKTGGH